MGPSEFEVKGLPLGAKTGLGISLIQGGFITVVKTGPRTDFVSGRNLV